MTRNPSFTSDERLTDDSNGKGAHATANSDSCVPDFGFYR